MIVRLSKTSFVLAIAFFATLVSFGNITDYGSNFEFVKHVLLMDTIFPDATIKYRAIEAPWMHHAGYVLIIAAETATAILCWIGGAKMFAARGATGAGFNRSKRWAVAGLTLGFLTWQVGFMSVGGEWFGMWMSDTWNGIQSAFRFFITIIAVLIYVVMPDGDLE